LTSNLKAAQLSRQIDQIVEKKKMLRHPFYQVWTEGKLSLDAIREYAKQYYYFVYQFPTFISAIHSNATKLEDRQMLLSNLMDEEAGEKNHPELWLSFCDGLGLSRSVVKAAPPLPETENLTSTFKKLCQRRSYAGGVAALYAYESQIPDVSAEKIETLRKFYNITSSDSLEFFAVHQEADIEHSRISREILDKITDESEKKKALQSARKLSRSLWKFLDGMYENFVLKREQPVTAV
jgi:pyrroloquinoline-quinone synthase